MTIRQIVAKSAKSLHPAASVTDYNDPYVRKAAQDLLDTLAAEQKRLDELHPGMGGGVGLASNQLEYSTPDYPEDFIPPDMYVISIRPERAHRENCNTVLPTVYINASYEVFPNNTLEKYVEGCLSLNGIQGLTVIRNTAIKVSAYDTDGTLFVILADNFIARVHQHEQDHCRGKEYLNHLDFSNGDLEDIRRWIEENKNKPTPTKETVIVNNLICTGDPVDFEALSSWVEGNLKCYEHRM